MRAPIGMADSVIQNFMREKGKWIAAKLAQQTAAVAPFSAVAEGKCLLDAGEEKPVSYNASRNGENARGFLLKNQNSVRGYFERTRGWLLTEQLHALAQTMGVQPKSVSLCDFKARWGSCDAGKNIKLNWRLTMLPPALRDYVIIHELCHLRELNHSSAFWRIVEKYCPDYRSRRRSLRDYSFLTQLYRRSSSE